MNEARRVLRYVFPGLVMILEFAFYYIFLYYEPGKRRLILSFITNDNISSPLIALLASGGIGYFLATVYNAVYWTKLFNNCGVNHQKMLIDAEKLKLIELRQRDDDTLISAKKVSRKGAWRIITATWYANGSTPKPASDRADSLADILHGLGAASFGSIFAVILWLLLSYPFGKSEMRYGIIPIVIIPIIIVVVHFITYKTTASNVQNTIEIMFFDMFNGVVKDKEHPKKIYVSLNDLENNKRSIIVRFWETIVKRLKLRKP